jgi:hypothetical protein
MDHQWRYRSTVFTIAIAVPAVAAGTVMLAIG